MASKKLNTRGTIKQDLTAAKAELKQFRHDVSILKKRGILDKSIYDARSVTPSKYLKAQIKKFSNVLSGEAQTVRVSKAKKKYYQSKGYEVKGDRVIVPIQKNERAYPVKGDFRVKVTGIGGSIVKIDLGLNPQDITKWAQDLRNSKYKLKSDELIRFQLFGNNSYAGFGNLKNKTAMQRMAEYIENYPMFQDTENESNPDKVAEIIQGITIFKIKRDPITGDYPKLPKNAAAMEVDEEQKRRAATRRREALDRRIGRMSDARYQDYRRENAETERLRRSELTADKKEAYKLKAKERAAKSRAKRKPS